MPCQTGTIRLGPTDMPVLTAPSITPLLPPRASLGSDSMSRITSLVVLLASGTAPAADLAKLDRSLAKEPAYATKAPRYALLVFGPASTDRAWLVKDGDALYVDRNGNGDLTDKGEKVPARKGGSAEDGYTFEVPDLTLGGTKHYNLSITVQPLRRCLFGENAQRKDLQAAAKKDPEADTLSLSIQSPMPHLRRDGRVMFLVGPIDLDGPLCLAASPKHAPIVHLGGPLEVTFYSSRPTLRRSRTSELIFVVGTRGLGAGTFAMLGYDDTIPKDAHPVGDMTFAPPKAGGDPVKKRFEFKERC